MEDFTEDIDRYIGKYSKVLDSVSKKEIWGAANLLLEALSNGSKIFIVSENATVAERIELILSGCRFKRTEKRFDCQSMCQNLGNITDVTANSYDNIFSSQLDGMMEKDDVLIAVSYDGKRKNTVKAAEYSKICGCKVLSITGGHGGRLSELSNCNILILDNDKGIIDLLSVTAIRSAVEQMERYLS